MNQCLIMGLAAVMMLSLAMGCARMSRCAAGPEQPAPLALPEIMIARHTARPVALTGKLDDPAWRNALAYPLRLSADCGGVAPLEQGEVRLLWDTNYLYVGVKYEDSDVVQEGDRDQQLFYRSGDLVEVFLKPEKSSWCWEIYATPNGRQSVFWFAGPGRRLPSSFEKHAMRDLKVVADVQGTFNNWHDRDESWSAELAIPAKELAQYGDTFGPGAQWRVLIARYNYSIHLPECERSMSPQLSKTIYYLLEEYAVLKFEK